MRHVAALLLPLLFGSALAAEAPPTTGRIIVQWRDSEPADVGRDRRVREVEERAGLQLQRVRAVGARMEVLRLPTADAASERAALRELRANSAVEFAVPDGRVRAHAVTPNDPLFNTQWYLESTQIAATRATSAWDITLGGTPLASPVVIAVIDTGVRFEHPDLGTAAAGGKLLPGFDFVSGDKGNVFATANDGDGWDADPSDPGDFLSAADLQSDLYKGKKCGGGDDQEQPLSSSWHGTRVSGLIAAASDNGQGITGTAYHVRVVPVRALGKCGGYDSDVLAAMYWSAGLNVPAALLAGTPTTNANPARIINMSLGGVGACSAAYKQAVGDVLAAGVLIVASAGNEGGPVDSPANCAGVLGVAGLRHAGTKVGYSNVGTEVGIAAPAGNCVNVAESAPCLFSLITTTNAGAEQPAAAAYTSPTYKANVGTSFSSPLAAAGAGLMLAVNPKLTPGKLTSRLRESARAFPTMSDNTPQPSVCHVPTSTSDVQDVECICTTTTCGAGMLDISAAVTTARRPVALATVSGTVGAGRPLTLVGSASAAATGRSIASYAWTVVTTSGGAAMPTLATPAAASTTLLSPVSGSVTLRLTVTDDANLADTADVTIEAATSGGTVDTPSAPSPTTPAAANSGGGGASDAALLTFLAAALAVSLPARRKRRSSRAHEPA
ncbi:MAG: S8 family serine peptidase [Steroidobacteraceae bacterium]